MLMKDGDIVDIKGKGKIEDFIKREIGLWYSVFMKWMMFGEGIKRVIEECNWDKKKILEEVFDLELLKVGKGIGLEDKNKLICEIKEVEDECEMVKKELEGKKEG